MYLLFQLMLPREGGIQVVGLIGPLLGPDEHGLYHLPGDHFKGLAVPLIEREQQPRKHGENHNQRRRAGGDAAPEYEKKRYAYEKRPAKTNQLPFRQA